MKQMNRWVLAWIGVFMLLFIGLVYAWTVLQAPIAKQYPDWSAGQISLTFTISMFCFCIGSLISGILQKKTKAKYIVWAGAVMFLVSMLLCSAADSLWIFYLGFGFMAGMATGLAYNAIISSITAWFTDKQGLASGMLLMGFGLSAFIIGKVYTAFTPADGGDGWRTSFRMIGILLFLVLGIGGFFIVKPDSDAQSRNSAGKKEQKRSYEELTTKEMLQRRSFWLFFIWSILLSLVGLGIISQGTTMALVVSPDTSMGTVATIVGLISIFGGVGRIAFGSFFDKFGHLRTMLCGAALYGLAIIFALLALSFHSMVVLSAAYVVLGCAQGCSPPTSSAFVSRFYGQKDYPTNYSVANMFLLIGSFGSVIAGTVFDLTNSYTILLIVLLVFAVISMILPFFIKKPEEAKKA